MLKLEVGKVYVSAISSKYRILFYDGVNKCFYGRNVDDAELAFLFKEDGECKGEGWNLIKEHKEPYKKIAEGWVVYNDSVEYEESHLLDELTGKCTNGMIYRDKYKAQASLTCIFKKILKIKITVEED